MKSANLRIEELIRKNNYQIQKQTYLPDEDQQSLTQYPTRKMEGQKYDMTTSVFSDGDEILPEYYNILDVFIGEAHFEQAALIKLQAFSDEIGSEL